MNSFRFESWWFLFLIPLATIALLWLDRTQARSRVLFSSTRGLSKPPVTFWNFAKRSLVWIECLGVCLLIIALARPQFGRSETRIHGEGIAIELILDISGSMEAIDFEIEGEQVNRLLAVKHVVRDFVRGSPEMGLPGRPNDQIGLVVFGGFADTRCPLTLDHTALVDIVEALQVPAPILDSQRRIVNKKSLEEELATAIGDGLALGVDQLKKSKAETKIAVLLTDGDSNAGVVDPKEAIRVAKQLGIKVYTIGIGRDGIVPLPKHNEFGSTVIMPARLSVDEKLLKEIASETGGMYFHSSDTEGLANVYQKIDELEKTQLEETRYDHYTELYRWFLSTGLGVIVMVHLLRQTRFRLLK